MQKSQQTNSVDAIVQPISAYEEKKLKERYKFLTYYLKCLYKTHENLELEIVVSLFNNKELEYHEFINGKLKIEQLEAVCNRILIFLKNHSGWYHLIDYSE